MQAGLESWNKHLAGNPSFAIRMLVCLAGVPYCCQLLVVRNNTLWPVFGYEGKQPNIQIDNSAWAQFTANIEQVRHAHTHTRCNARVSFIFGTLSKIRLKLNVTVEQLSSRVPMFPLAGAMRDHETNLNIAARSCIANSPRSFASVQFKTISTRASFCDTCLGTVE